MHNDIFVIVLFLPGKVMVILKLQDGRDTKVVQDGPVNKLVIGSGILSHQLHGLPVLMPLHTVKIKPGQMGQFLWQFRMEIHRKPAVIARNVGACPPAAAVTDHGKIFTGRKLKTLFNRKHPELDKMIAAAACAELAPGLVLEAGNKTANS